MQRKNMIERKQNPEQKGRTILRNILITVGIMGAATIVCLALQHFSEADTHVPLLFVLAVVIVARFTEGYVYGILSAMAAVVLVNYVFTYPYFELNFSITGYPLTFVVMLATAVMVSALTTQIKWQEQIRLEVEKEKARANLLRAVSPRYPNASDVNSGIRVGNFRQLRRAGTAGEGGAFRRHPRRIPVADPDGGKPAFDHAN